MSKKQIETYKAVQDSNTSLAYKVKHGLPASKKEQGQMNAFLNATRQVSNTPASYNKKYKGTSPKVERIVKDIKERYEKDKNYKGLTYSNYLGSGVARVERELKKNKIPYGKFTGKTTKKDREEIIKKYNKGEIKQLLVSGAGSEGLDLKGTKMVQLMEPHWNNARERQVKGRAIRFESHVKLPKEEQGVNVKNYYSVMPERGKLKRLILGKNESSDQYLRNLADKKDELSEDFLKPMQKTAYQVLTHTTKKENLHNILDSGKLMPIKHLKEQYPELEVNYEHKKGKTHRISDKLKNIRNHHNSDKLFFAADRYDPRYGDYTIVKKLKKAEDNPVKWTLIPNEKIVKNPVSVRSNATIYVPNNELGE